MAEQFEECLQPAGGGTYANDHGLRAGLARFLGGWPHKNAGPTLISLLCQSPPLPSSPKKTQHVSCHSGDQPTD
jgi:hypothetical protein